MEASLPTTKSARGAGRIIDARRIEDLPLWLFALLIVAGFNAIALGGLVCTRRFGQSLGLYTFIENDTVGAIFSAILVMYAISLGLIAVASWGNTTAAAAAASEEASHIATVYRTLGGYPQPLQDDLKDSVARYTQSIIEKAWPAQQRGEVTEAGIEIICHALELDAGPASLLGQIRDLARLFASQALAMPVADIPAD